MTTQCANKHKTQNKHNDSQTNKSISLFCHKTFFSFFERTTKQTNTNKQTKTQTQTNKQKQKTKTKTKQIVENVHEFAGHIACSSKTNSEIVVPICYSDGRLIGVLDLDALDFAAFDFQDQIGLQNIVQFLITACDWPADPIH